MLGGLLIYVMTIYCNPARRTGNGRGREGLGLYPKLGVLGIQEGKSPALIRDVGRLTALLPSYETVQQELAERGLKLNIKEVHGIGQYAGQAALAYRRRELELYREGKLPAADGRGKRFGAMIDGGRTKIRKTKRKQKGRGKTKTQKRRFHTDWREPKQIIVFEMDERGRMKKGTKPILDGTFQGPDEIMEVLAMRLHQVGAAQANVVAFRSDGAPWIWDRLDWVIRRVGLKAKQVSRGLDWCHAVHHISLALEPLVEEADRKRVFKRLRKWLKAGSWRKVVRELMILTVDAEDAKLPKTSPVWTEIDYLERHGNAGHLGYATYRRRGLPLGSGAIESVIRRVINLRMKGNAFHLAINRIANRRSHNTIDGAFLHDWRFRTLQVVRQALQPATCVRQNQVRCCPPWPLSARFSLLRKLTMRHRMSVVVFVGSLAAIGLLAPSAARAEVRLPRVFSDRVVLQRDRAIPIWGWAAPGEAVTVTLGEGSSVSSKADAVGRWRIDLPALKAGGPHKLTVAGKNTVVVNDVLVGEVWVCVGQSNMQMRLSQSEHAKRDIAKANDPLLRLGSSFGPLNTFPQADGNASWNACTPGNAAGYSAVAYYFGKHLREKLGVPVGILHGSAGAIPIEAWTPADGCNMIPSQTKIARLVDQVRADFRTQRERALTAWMEKAREAVATEMPLPAPPAVSDLIVQRGWMPTTLYNSSIHPLIPFAIRGAVLYQGEANNGNGMEYYDKMQALIGGWRKAWGQGDFPFLFVQLAPWSKYPDGNLEGIWEAQRESLAIPNTGMAVTTDLVPDLNDIHPPRKMEIGDRLALWALANTYGHDKLVYSGPLYRSAKIDDGKIRVHFHHVGGGLTSRNGKPLDSFQIGTADGFVDAEAKIDGDSIVVWNEKIPQPEFIRFGWKNTANPNLINKEGLPASPFRTDCGPVKFSTGTRFANHTNVLISPEYFKGVIRYTVDGSTPTEKSPIYSGPIGLDKSSTISARLFANNGRRSVTARQTYSKVAPSVVNGQTLVPGLNYEYYVGRWTAMPDYKSLKADRSGSLDSLDPPVFSENFMCAHRLKGYIEIPTAGVYTFSLKCHGGAQLMIGETLAVDDEGFPGPVEKTGAPLRLTAGKHPITILYHEGGGSPLLALSYEGPGHTKQLVPSTAFYRNEEPHP